MSIDPARTADVAFERRRVISDGLGLVCPLVLALLVAIAHDATGALARFCPVSMGFIAFALLLTWGDCLKARLSGGSWLAPRLFARIVVWGLIGMWVSMSFRMINDGVSVLIVLGEWPALFRPLSLSLWANVCSGFVLILLAAQCWADQLNEGEWLWPWQILGHPEAITWARVVLPSCLLFWLPAHMLTFALPEDGRVICAACLSLVFGLMLYFAGLRTGLTKEGPLTRERP